MLIVEDDQEIINLLEIHLKDLGFEVHQALDGLEGLNKIFSIEPDLIILDVSLPSMDGFEICKQARAKVNTPIIMLTAKSCKLFQLPQCVTVKNREGE